jgi:hypothetical protein
VRTTLDIPDDLFADATDFAARAGRDLNDVIAEGLRRVVSTAPASVGDSDHRVRLPIIECGEPGTLNIPDDAGSKLEMMEDTARHAASL